MMSNTEQDKQRSGQIEEDDEPDDWWVVGWRGSEWIAIADDGSGTSGSSALVVPVWCPVLGVWD